MPLAFIFRKSIDMWNIVVSKYSNFFRSTRKILFDLFGFFLNLFKTGDISKILIMTTYYPREVHLVHVGVRVWRIAARIWSQRNRNNSSVKSQNVCRFKKKNPECINARTNRCTRIIVWALRSNAPVHCCACALKCEHWCTLINGGHRCFAPNNADTGDGGA